MRRDWCRGGSCGRTAGWGWRKGRSLGPAPTWVSLWDAEPRAGAAQRRADTGRRSGWARRQRAASVSSGGARAVCRSLCGEAKSALVRLASQAAESSLFATRAGAWAGANGGGRWCWDARATLSGECRRAISGLAARGWLGMVGKSVNAVGLRRGSSDAACQTLLLDSIRLARSCRSLRLARRADVCDR